jgi:hypothetical protein
MIVPAQNVGDDIYWLGVSAGGDGGACRLWQRGFVNRKKGRTMHAEACPYEFLGLMKPTGFGKDHK